MTLVTRRARLADLAAGMRAGRAFDAHDAWSRPQLLAFQQERLAELRAFTADRSPFYRDRDASATLDKPTLMEHYDRIVTDPRLSLDRLERHIDGLRGDELLDGEYRVMATGGTSGRRAVMAYSRAEWRLVMSGFFRWTTVAARSKRPRRRIAIVLAPGAHHMTWRISRTADVGLMRLLRLDAASPLAELRAALEAFRPHELGGYPSALALLAREQLAGRLAIAPELVSTSSEVRTPEMLGAMREAWGVEPFDVYGITEAGMVAVDCPEHAGLHVLEEHTLVEVLDDDGRPVPDGEVGRLVVTPLHNRTLPLLRYEMADLVRVTAEPCRCGRPHQRLLEIQGRQDDVLTLRGAGGGTVRVHPIALRSPMASVPGLAEYQLVCGDGGLGVRLTLREGADAAGACEAARRRLAAALAHAGAAVPDVDVQVVDTLERSPLGKHRLVVQA